MECYGGQVYLENLLEINFTIKEGLVQGVEVSSG